jgi:hypothetical protein
MADHPYDAPGLSPLEFLLAVIHDPTVPLNHRMDAAVAAAPYRNDPRPYFRERPHWPGESAITIRIEPFGNGPPELIQPEPKTKVH